MSFAKTSLVLIFDWISDITISMKNSTMRELHNFFVTNDANIGNGFLFDKAFRIYALGEIASPQDFWRAPDEFCDYLSGHMEFFNAVSVFELMVAFPRQLEMFYRFVVSCINPDERAEFVDAASELLINGSKTKTLDVGAGQIPLSSFMLADGHENISAMDHFFIPTQTIERFHVTPRDEYLTPLTDVSEYEMLIANTPCAGTRDMIRVAAENNLPYFIRFCDCGLPHRKHGKKPVKNWQKVLQKLDPRMRIFTCASKYRSLEKFGYVGPLPDGEVEKILVSAYKNQNPTFAESLADFLVDVLSELGD